MLYTIFIYGSEDRVARWTPEEERDVMGRHAALRNDLTASGRLGPVLRLTPNTVKTVKRYKERSYVTDGPFIESKEQLMGLYVVDCASFEAAVAAAERLSFETGVFEIAQLTWLTSGDLPPLIPDRHG